MTVPFIGASTRALREVRTAQRQHARLKAKADARLQAARAGHLEELDAAAAIEALAWQHLMAVYGMTVATAAALAETSESAVHRWVTHKRPRSGARARLGADETAGRDSSPVR